jgi:hypothetical protein
MNQSENLILATMDAAAYVFVTFLFVLYMLFEESSKDNASNVSRSHSRASQVRVQIDAQIQQYLVVKVSYLTDHSLAGSIPGNAVNVFACMYVST